ncbi:MAG: hypothetical protein VW268_11565 [Rhodospirillaceae bacterium]
MSDFRFGVFALALLGACAQPEPQPSANSKLPPASLTAEAVDLTWTRAYVYLPADLSPFTSGILGGRRPIDN